MNREPVLSFASVTAAVTAVLSLLVAFGLNLSDAQSAGILAVVAVVAPLLAGFVSRKYVTPVVDPMNDDGTALVPE